MKINPRTMSTNLVPPTRRFSQLFLFLAMPVMAGDLYSVTATQNVPFPDGGTLRIERSNGAIHIRGWDKPEVEVTFIKSTYNPKNHAKLARVESKAERRGDEVVISTVAPRWADIQVDYEIHAPRKLALAIEHGKGGVYVTDMDGDIQANVRDGQITLRLPEAGVYSIEAHTGIGEIYSDFGGEEKYNIHFGKRLTKASDTGHKLNLRVGFGDIMILKTPYHPRPVT
jgi:hypothetical protein